MRFRSIPLQMPALSLARLLLAWVILAANGILFAQADRGLIE